MRALLVNHYPEQFQKRESRNEIKKRDPSQKRGPAVIVLNCFRTATLRVISPGSTAEGGSDGASCT